MPRNAKPLSPLFDPEAQYGAVDVGNTPGTTPVPTFVRITQDDISEVTNATGIVTDGTYLYCTGFGSDNALSISIASPLAPAFLDEVIDGTSLLSAWGVAIDTAADYIYVAADEYLVTIDISSPAAMTIDAEVNNTDLAQSYNCWYDTVAQELTIVATGYVVTYDMSNPSSPSLVDSTAFTGYFDVYAADGVAYLAGNDAVTTIQTSDGSILDDHSPAELTGASRLLISGSVAFVVTAFDTETRLVCVDVTDPSALTTLGSVALSADNPYQDGLAGLAISGSTLWIAMAADNDNLNNLFVMNVTDPTTPTEITRVSIDGDGTANMIYLNGILYGTDPYDDA